jgi:hypothetical protein
MSLMETFKILIKLHFFLESKTSCESKSFKLGRLVLIGQETGRRFRQSNQSNYTYLSVQATVKKQCCGSASARIRINWPDPDPHPEFLMPDPDPADTDPRTQNWHLINLFTVEKYCE